MIAEEDISLLVETYETTVFFVLRDIDKYRF